MESSCCSAAGAARVRQNWASGLSTSIAARASFQSLLRHVSAVHAVQHVFAMACMHQEPLWRLFILDAGIASLEHPAAGAEALCNLSARVLSRAGCGEGSKGHGNASFSALLLQWTPASCMLNILWWNHILFVLWQAMAR